jgi:hypothetical protein
VRAAVTRLDNYLREKESGARKADGLQMTVKARKRKRCPAVTMTLPHASLDRAERDAMGSLSEARQPDERWPAPPHN